MSQRRLTTLRISCGRTPVWITPSLIAYRLWLSTHINDFH